MSLDQYKNIWVFVETLDGTAKSVGYELLTPARLLADASGEKLVAVVIGENVEDAVKQASEHGADEIIIVHSPQYKKYQTEAYTYALAQLVEKYKPSALLIGATNLGRDLGPRLACRVKTGLTADCTQIDYDESSGNVAWTRPAFSGNLMATILCSDHRPQIGTIRPGVFKKPDKVEKQSLIKKEDIVVPKDKIRTRIVETIIEDKSFDVKIEESNYIVSGGAGLLKQENFVILEDLAKSLNGTVAGSRAVVDMGWIPQSRQVGQTGKTVQPTIYVACGISGAIQHQAGMSSSDKIIAINKDKDANIFQICDYAVVGDLHKIVPLITENIKRIRES